MDVTPQCLLRWVITYIFFFFGGLPQGICIKNILQKASNKCMQPFLTQVLQQWISALVVCWIYTHTYSIMMHSMTGESPSNGRKAAGHALTPRQGFTPYTTTLVKHHLALYAKEKKKTSTCPRTVAKESGRPHLDINIHGFHPARGCIECGYLHWPMTLEWN